MLVIQETLPEQFINRKNNPTLKIHSMTILNNITRCIGFMVLSLGPIFCGIWPTPPLSYGQSVSLSENGLGTIVTPKGTTIFVEIADSPDKRAQGLMFRPSMATDRGMLFLFPEPGDQAFWMKNTLISLDIFWLDESGTILHLEPNVPICTRKDDGCPRYQAPHKSLQILELNAGMAEKLDLAVGNQLKIDLPPMSFPY
ncbi:MAG: DUF192 domain-containing protein [Nitrospirota bacterium]